MRIKVIVYIIVAGFIFSAVSCDPSKSAVKRNQTVEFTILQLNDVYEISPLENGKVAGLARVATIRNRLLEGNPNTITVLSGDFLNPSIFSVLKHEGEKVRGMQMVEVLNSLNLDLVTFGNHEFDLSYDDLQERIDSSRFSWISSNVQHKVENGKTPFGKNVNGEFVPIEKQTIISLKNKNNFEFNIGFFGVTLPFNKAEYVVYDSVITSAQAAHKKLLSQRADMVIGITHLEMDGDKELAEAISEIPLLAGGHDHNNMIEHVGSTTITKADANAKSVYIHRIKYNRKKDSIGVISELRMINDSIPEDPVVAEVVAKWMALADKSLTEQGFDPKEVVANIAAPVDGRESFIRYYQSDLGEMIGRAMRVAYNGADCAILNSGSIRIDDQIQGEITQYDILRMLPFGGKVIAIEIPGRFLFKILEAGLANRGSGGYLQWERIFFDPMVGWKISRKRIDFYKNYVVVIPEFLFTGMEANLEFLVKTHPDIINVTEPDNENDYRNDIRKVVIAYLKSLGK